MEIETILGNRSDLDKFLEKCTLHDKNILKRYYRISEMRKRIMVLHRVSPFSSRVFIVPLDALPHLKTYIRMRKADGFCGIRMPRHKYFCFGSMIRDQEEEIAPPTILEPVLEKRKPGRPKKNESSSKIYPSRE